MCLIAIDGTWSYKFNNRFLGKDQSGFPIGVLNAGMSNTYRFLRGCGYPKSRKFYFGGPQYGMSGYDVTSITQSVFDLIESLGCKEIALVGWSRGGVVASEVAEILHYGKRREMLQTRRGTRLKGFRDFKNLPTVKFVGLFDPVSMTIATPLARSESDATVAWGEEIPSKVKYVAQVIAGKRDGPIPGIPLPFYPASPNVQAQVYEECTMVTARHADVGGLSDSPHAQVAYHFIRTHATKAGVP